MQRAANVTSEHQVDWHAIDWKRIYRTVKNLRQRIFRASRASDLTRVRSFEWSSYGFRPGRGCHDAIESIFRVARPGTTRSWVLDADIAEAFNNIGHAALEQAVGNFPVRELIKQGSKPGTSRRKYSIPPMPVSPKGAWSVPCC